jgi:hypothetical protein
VTKFRGLILGALCLCALFASVGTAAAANHNFTATATGEPNLSNRPEFRFNENPGIPHSCEQMSFSGILGVPAKNGIVSSSKYTSCWVNPSFPGITITGLGSWKISPGPVFENVHLHITYGVFKCAFDVTGTIYGTTTSETAVGATWAFPAAANKKSLVISNAVGGNCPEFHIANGVRGEFIAPKGMQVKYTS